MSYERMIDAFAAAMEHEEPEQPNRAVHGMFHENTHSGDAHKTKASNASPYTKMKKSFLKNRQKGLKVKKHVMPPAELSIRSASKDNAYPEYLSGD